MRLFKNRIRVIRLWKWNNFQLELCIFPPKTEVHWHKHDLVNVEVMHLFGWAHYSICKPDDTQFKNQRTYFADTCKGDRFRQFTVPYSYWHRATIYDSWVVTLSIQRWICDKPLLITEDYTEPKI